MGESDTDIRYYLIARSSHQKPFQFVNIKGRDIEHGKLPYFDSRGEVLERSQQLQSRGYETHIVENIVPCGHYITLETRVTVDFESPGWSN